jgi:DNA-binding transcriptional regulator YhcF (GntR family)
MDISIDGASDVPIRRQLTEQIIFLIATERLKTGDFMPSVRELARRLKIHHNTVSDAYQDLVKRNWLQRRRGSRLVVGLATTGEADTLDDLINMTIRMARSTGYSLQSLRERVRERLLAEPPDHILVVEQDPGLRGILQEELSAALEWPVEGCGRQQLVENPGLAIGALAVTPQHAITNVDPLFPKDRPVVPVSFSSADEPLQTIRKLRHPSVIAVVSASEIFLHVARGILAPAVGERHELRDVLLPEENLAAVRSADLVFCDSIAKQRLDKLGKVKAIHYRLLLPESLEYVKTAMKSYQSTRSEDI